MCGRFSLAPEAGMLEELFPGLEVPRDLARQRYNVAPTQSVLGVVDPGQGLVYQAFRWGLIPCWARDAKIGASMINARGETVATKPAFRAAFRRQRCLVVADGFYEWRADPRTGRKQPFHIRLRSGRPFAFAGLWDRWQPPLSGQGGSADEPAPPIVSCTIVTTEPNLLMREIHDRMPVILAPETFATWLDPRLQDVAILQGLLRPLPEANLEAYPVSTAVNNPRKDSPECTRPVPLLVEPEAF